MWRQAGLAASFAALALAACAQSPERPPKGVAPGAQPLWALPGWESEDYLAALDAVRAACATARDAAMSAVCKALSALRDPSESRARDFLEHRFVAERIAGESLLTGYFMPVYPARWSASGEFDAPVRPKPADLPAADQSPGAHTPYAGRAEIEQRPADDALAWMRPEDLFFMQIQGAGGLEFPDGTRRKAVFAGTNGATFVAIAKPMLERGLLTLQNASASAIHAWLATHRGPVADALMDQDPRYVFYSLSPDDGLDPVGAAGVRLVAGRSAAVDPAYVGLGSLLWIDADAPKLAGAFPVYRRLVAALDAGGAIRGSVRADLYLGRGPRAGDEAGRIRHSLTLWTLAPK